MKISTLGDSALLIDFADESPNPDVLLVRALSAAAALERARIAGVREITSAYQSVALFLDVTCTEGSLEENIRQVVLDPHTEDAIPHRSIQIPVCYDTDFGLDAVRIVEETQLPLERIVELHSSAEFTVACIGFMPGFPYLAGLPQELRVPRLASPRTKVPAGSVAIANAQAGIYPLESPGGWNIIGRTPLRMFQPYRAAPTLLLAGDRVRFQPITREKFEAALTSNKD
jgi:KipI family sensor histidine kinase inhibitor